MIGQVIALKFFGKENWGKAVMFGVYNSIAMLVVNLVLARFQGVGMLLSLLVGIPVMYLILKHLINYPEKGIWRIVWISFAINLILSLVLMVFIGSFIIGILVGQAGRALSAL